MIIESLLCLVVAALILLLREVKKLMVKTEQLTAAVDAVQSAANNAIAEKVQRERHATSANA